MEILISDCGTCKFNEGDELYPICRYEEIDEDNNYMNATLKELETMYTEECVRYEEKKKINTLKGE